MGMGDWFSGAMSQVSDAGLATLRSVVSAASSAGAKAADLAGRAAQATLDGAQAAARKTAAATLLGSELAIAGGAVAAVKTTAPLANAAGGAYQTAAKAGQKIKQTFNNLRERYLDYQPVARPCLPCLGSDSAEARAARINKRNSLIAGCEHSNDPQARDAAKQLREDMKAVEMARLSENTYAQFDPEASESERKPPEPWKAMTQEELIVHGIDPNFTKDSKAVFYTAPDNFPFNPKTVVAFRGTTSEAEDIFTDHDQALGLKTRQYEAATALGRRISEIMPNAEVTGHSLGGGKAQAAGVAGRLSGQMFNSAGLHPKSVGILPESLAAFSKQFAQYRAEGGTLKAGGDPLTGVQNSKAAQQLTMNAMQGLQKFGRANQWALKEIGINDPFSILPESAQKISQGLADRILNITPQEAARNMEYSGGKWHIPPAVGEVRNLTSKNADGTDANAVAQHSITKLVYGFESRKANNIETLLAKMGSQEPAGNYIGKMITTSQ